MVLAGVLVEVVVVVVATQGGGGGGGGGLSDSRAPRKVAVRVVPVGAAVVMVVMVFCFTDGWMSLCQL